ncbi:MAG: OmpA family protein [Treponema sp.]|nr:OmpA family protein [Treponema sp.]
MKRLIPYCACMVFICTGGTLSAQDAAAKLLRYQYAREDTSRILSTVEEDVFINGNLHHHATIVNRISVKVTDTARDGSGTIEATFMTTEKGNNVATDTPLQWGEQYESVFTRDSRGYYTISDDYFMPTVRDVPVFPDYAVRPGDTWTARGHEAHDLRQTFEIETPFKIPFDATYTYTGTEQGDDGRIFDIIEVTYSLYFESPAPTRARAAAPQATNGYSRQTLFWDNEKGQLDHYAEEFRITIETYAGDIFLFVGAAQAEVTQFIRAGTEKNVADIQATVEELGLENISVTRTEQGLTISIENIAFQANSARLENSEREKLNEIAKILAEYPNDLLITGHTALSGTAAGRKQLSEQRAQAVATYLIEKGVRKNDAIFIEGRGAENPVASNDTQAGRAQNRRVEITILDE